MRNAVSLVTRQKMVTFDKKITWYGWWDIWSFCCCVICLSVCVTACVCPVSLQALSQRSAALLPSLTHMMRSTCQTASPINLSWLQWSLRFLLAEAALLEAPSSQSLALVSGTAKEENISLNWETPNVHGSLIKNKCSADKRYLLLLSLSLLGNTGITILNNELQILLFVEHVWHIMNYISVCTRIHYH